MTLNAHSTYVVREKFSKLSMCDEGLVTLPNNERMKVEGIREVIIKTHGGVKRRLGDVRYVPKFERNFISLGRLEAKGCAFKASRRTLKVIRENLVLMKGKRSESNLYELQVSSSSLGRKLDDGVVCESIKKVTFEDRESIGLVGEIVNISVKTLNNDVEF